MMPRKLTRTEEITGHKFVKSRIDSALTSCNSFEEHSPLPRHNNAFAVSITAGVIGVIICLVMSILRRSPEIVSQRIVSSQSGGLYVNYNGTFYPALNAASARLIAQSADTPRPVKDSELARVPRGQQIGIIGAPNMLTQSSSTEADWSLCDQWSSENTSLTTPKKVTTTLITGKHSSSLSDLDDHTAILAQYSSQWWIIWHGTRSQIGTSDYPTQEALGITSETLDNAHILSEALFNGLPAVPPQTVPIVPHIGKPFHGYSKSKIGDVFTITNLTGERTYWLGLQDGVQEITPYVAQLFINNGARKILVDTPTAITKLPQRHDIDLSRYPTTAPKIITPFSTCYQWQKQENASVATTSIVWGDQLPLTVDDQKKIIPCKDGKSCLVDQYFIPPGNGYLVRVTGEGNSSLTQEQTLWIDDSANRYFLDPGYGEDEPQNYEKNIQNIEKNLGFTHDALPIPWSIARNFLSGPSLSVEAAMFVHPQFSFDREQKKVEN